MPAKIHRIKLSKRERDDLEKIIKKPNGSAARSRKSRALLLCDEGKYGSCWKDEQIVTATGMSTRSIESLRKRCCESGPLQALERKKRETPPVPAKITGEVEAYITKLACSQPPEGQSRWTMKLIAERVVELEMLDSISGESVRQVLKKTR